MKDRIEQVYNAIDEMAAAILHNTIPMQKETMFDPNTLGLEPCEWPATYLRYKESIKKREAMFNREPLTDLQWWTIETYLAVQYGLTLKRRSVWQLAKT